MSSNRDFGVEQFFRADEFRAVDPSLLIDVGKNTKNYAELKIKKNKINIKTDKKQRKTPS